MLTHPQVPDREIFQLAREFVRAHGQAAVELVTNKEHQLLRDGDVAGAGTVRRVRREIEKLVALEPVSLLVH